MPAGISPLSISKPWKNYHENFEHRFTEGASWVLDHAGEGLSDTALYRRATANLQWAIGEAMRKGHTLRAMGGNWSFSPVAMCSGGMVQTNRLDLVFRPRTEHVVPAYLAGGKTIEGLHFAECGTQIARLNKLLEIECSPRRAIRASGGSNGQTIAGATSTGTHGAALYTGAVHDAIVGLHIVTGPDSHVWIERKSRPVASDAFVQWLGATPIRDDEAFNAAVVSFGSFGIIHGIMIESEPIYLLQEYRISNVPYSKKMFDAIAALDIPSIRRQLPDFPENRPGHELYHMEINMNPYTAKPDGSEGVHIFLFFKVPCPAAYVPVHGGDGVAGPSPEFIWMMNGLLGALGKKLSYNHIRNATTSEFDKNLRPALSEARSIGGIFRDTRFSGNIASFALAISTADLPRTLAEILAEIGKQAFAGAIAVRFVKGTPATLGFTRFANSAVVEMDGLDNKGNHAVFAAVLDRLDRAAITYTVHWGKLNGPVDEKRVLRMFGADRVQSWKRVRERLLSPAARAVFTNDFMKKCGLDKPSAAIA